MPRVFASFRRTCWKETFCAVLSRVDVKLRSGVSAFVSRLILSLSLPAFRTSSILVWFSSFPPIYSVSFNLTVFCLTFSVWSHLAYSFYFVLLISFKLFYLCLCACFFFFFFFYLTLSCFFIILFSFIFQFICNFLTVLFLCVFLKS